MIWAGCSSTRFIRDLNVTDPVLEKRSIVVDVQLITFQACQLSKFIFRHKIQEKTTTLIYFLFFNVISHIADIIAVKVTGPLYHPGYLLLLHCSNLFSKICLTRTKLLRCNSSSLGDNFSSTANDLFPFL